MIRKIILTLCLIPTVVGAESCEFTTFTQLTNAFYDRVHNQFGEPGERQSVDFGEYESVWSVTQNLATTKMPERLRQIYEQYRLAYERLDTIYAKNPSDVRVRTEWQCQQEFYIEEILNAFEPGRVGVIAPNCDQSRRLDPDTRIALRQELSEDNLTSCQSEEADGEPSAFALPADKTISLEQISPPILSLAQSSFSLLKDQVRRTVNPVLSLVSPEASTSTDNWWKNFTDGFFGLGRKDESPTDQSSDLRFSNYSNTRETNAATRLRRAEFENRRNFWLERSIASAGLLDIYDVRFGEDMLPDLDEGNIDLESALEAIATVCEEQRTVVKCWDGRNRVSEDKLWSPFGSFN